MTKEFTEVSVEAAMCLWEELISHRDDTLWKGYWDSVGTNQLRHDVIALSEHCDNEWKALSEDERENWVPYDWEWCPHFLRTMVDWDVKLGPRLKGK